MEVLKGIGAPQPRTETVDCPELGGAVICRGLLASEAFAVAALRNQATRRIREARAEHAAAQREGRPPAPFEPPELDFDELKAYGRYISHLLACGVTVANGLQLWSAEEWEVAGQQHPGLMDRLQAVVERLSGMGSEEDVRKNSPPTPS
jgi:hypothetical protein